MKSYPLVYAVILNYNGFDDSKECTEFLLNSHHPVNIIIIDNNSTDDSYLKLKYQFSTLKIIKSETNLGYAGGMNIGIQYALKENADFILLVNQDIVVTPGFLEPMLKKLYNDKKVGIVSCKVLYKNDKDKIYCAGGRISRLLCTGKAEYQGLKASDYANEEREITLAEGSFLMIKSEVFKKVGLLNEKFFMYLEDVEFSERVRKFFKIFYTNASIVYHKSGAGDKWSRYTPLYNYYYTRNRLWIYLDKSFISKIYVFLLSLVITIIKSISVLLRAGNSKLISFKSIWNGFKDGVFLMIGLGKRFLNPNKYRQN